ncbi:MAG: DUF692 domain-containing protein [Bdellovibrionaceae bacterium]|nr:DUF692 domain-containing protein [Pseudobdellovibrionaceae bacterium]
MGKVQNGDVASPAFFGGVGLRPTHYTHLLSEGAGSVQWFEAISENFMDSSGRPREILRKIRASYPVALHGVSMSLGSPEGINDLHLARLKSLADEIEPFVVSDHLCWNKFGSHYSHDLLPVEYTHESFSGLIRNIQQVQETLKRPLLVENVSAYIHSSRAEFTEWEFLVEVCQRTGCKILLDINNIYVNSVNFSFDPLEYLRAIPASLIGQIHLAGFTDMGDYLFDTHSKPVHEKVWELFKFKAPDLAKVPVLIEWDDDIPAFTELESELSRARQIWLAAQTKGPHEIGV